MISSLKRIVLSYSSPLCIFIGFFLLYSSTASKSIVQGDTGDFLSAIAVGGVPHEPGYPLYSMVATFVYHLPFGNGAWQVNILSAVFGTLALSIVYHITYTLTKNSIAAWFSVLTLGIYESFWWYNLVAEIHTLHILLTTLITLFLILFYTHKNTRYFFLAAFVFGLGVANNFTIIFMLPFFLVIFFVEKKRLIPIIMQAIFYASFGLLPYIYTLYTATHMAPVNWGRITDVASFLRFFFRADFGTILLQPPEPEVPLQYQSSVFFFTNLFTTSWYLLPAFLGSLYLVYKKNILIMFIFLSWLLFGPFFYLLMHVPVRSIVHEANALQYIAYPYVFFAILSGVGINLFSQKLANTQSYTNTKKIIIFVFVLFFSIPFLVTYETVREDNDTFVADVTHFQLSLLPKNATLLLWSDSVYFPQMYWQYVQHYRTDITAVQLSLFSAPWYRENMRQLYPHIKQLLTKDSFDYKLACHTLATKHMLYMAPWYPEYDTVWDKVGCTQIPYGLIVQIVPKNEHHNLLQIKQTNDLLWQKAYKTLQVSSEKNKTGYARKKEALFYLSEFFNFEGIYYGKNKQETYAYDAFSKAKDISPNQVNAIIALSSLLDRQNKPFDAIALLKEGIIRNPTSSALYKNLAIIYQQTNQLDLAKENYRLYLSFDPSDDPDTIHIMQFLQEN